MTKLSVNVNKIATLRNARGANNPNLITVVRDVERFGAQGITVHPRPDQRHIRYQDVLDLKSVVQTELNIEGNPTENRFVDLVLQVTPAQVTLVPDATDQLTSNHGWDTIRHQVFLKETVSLFKRAGIRVSLFIDPVEALIKGAADAGADRVELYTEAYATNYKTNPVHAIKPYRLAADIALQCGLAINAGHDLSLENLRFLHDTIPELSEVSIGHALICDALYFGLQNTIQLYKRCLQLS